MVRVSKDPVVRRREIVDAAIELFSHKGYAATSVNDILTAVGIAKGTFYHHFAAKEDVLRAVVSDLVDAGIVHAEALAGNTALPPADRFLAIIAAQRASGAKAALIPALEEAGNAEFRLLSHTRMIDRLTPVLAAVVREGIAEGIFDTPFPEESIAIVLTAAYFLADGVVDAGIDPELLVPALLVGAERLLGAAPGTFTTRAAALAPTPEEG